MDLTGKIIAILPARSGVSQKSGNAWMSQEYVLEVPGQYPKRMLFELFGEDKIKQANIQMGMEYNVQFDIDASEYKGKYYNHIKAYNVVPTQPSLFNQPATNNPAYSADVVPPVDKYKDGDDKDDDLPF